MIEHDGLPLLEPFKSIPVLGKPLVDLIEPAIREIVNLGYDNPDNNGWDDVGAASEAYALLLPTTDILNALVTTLPAYNLDVFDAISDNLDGIF